MQDWRQKIGGRWAISWLAYLITAPTSIVTVLLVDPIRTQENTSTWWFISVVTYIEFLALIYLADRTVLKNRRITPVSPWVVVATGFVLGFIKGASNIVFADALGIPQPLSKVLQGGISTGLSVAIAMPALAYIFATIAELVDQHRQFNQTHTSLITQQLQNLEVLNDFKVTLSETIKKRLGDTALIKETTPPLEPSAISIQLKQKVDEVRPLSHEFWERSEIQTPRYNPASLLRIFSQNQTIEFWPFLIFYIASSLPTITRFAGTESTTARVITTIMATTIVFAVGAHVLNSAKRLRVLIHASIVVFASAASTFLPHYIFGASSTTQLTSGFVIGVIWIGILSFSISFIVNADNFGKRILQLVTTQNADENLRAVALQNLQAKLNREVATYLHGQYQSQLLAIAVAMDEAENAGDAERLQLLLHDAVELLNNPLRRLEDPVTSDFETALVEFENHWAGVLDVRLRHECTREHSLDTATTLSVLLDEAARNAFRHGFATDLAVEIECSDSGVHLNVRDNGSGLHLEFSRGIGSALFDSHCGADWAIRNRIDGSAGAELTAKL